MITFGGCLHADSMLAVALVGMQGTELKRWKTALPTQGEAFPRLCCKCVVAETQKLGMDGTSA